jgi:ADP-ribose pyrophosphatase YjhB (NUDIX family)
MDHLITFDRADIRFSFRAVGIALHAGRVLLHRAVQDDFWALPGGRGELLETARDTIVREMCEELGETVAVERLVWVVENFFEYSDVRHHQLAFYWRIAFPADSPVYQRTAPWQRSADETELIFEWFPVAALERVRLFPTFLRHGLQHLPDQIVHLVHRDED